MLVAVVPAQLGASALLGHIGGKMEDLPEVKEIVRWEYKPGDRLIVRVDHPVIDHKHANDIAELVKARLKLPPDAPVVVTGNGVTFEVLAEVD
jgi:hypothetical protein